MLISFFVSKCSSFSFFSLRTPGERADARRAMANESLGAFLATSGPPSARVRAGHCGETASNGRDLGCLHDNRGSLGLTRQEATTWAVASAACAQKCASCTRCRYYSFSLKHLDCSWYTTCESLNNIQEGHRSAESNKKQPLGTLPPSGLRSVGSCDDYTIASQFNAALINATTFLAPVTFESLLGTLASVRLPRFAVNIGANDGATHDPVYPLFLAGYKGVAIEGDPRWNDSLVRTFAPLAGKVVHAIALVSPQNVAGLLRDHRTPKKLAALKVDIDSIDLPVLEAILEAGYRPMVIMVEINPDVPPPWHFHVTSSPGWIDRSGFYGASLQAAFSLLDARGFALVKLENGHGAAEHNAWFVHRSHVEATGFHPLSQDQMRAHYYKVFAHQASGRCLHMRPCPARTIYAAVAAAGFPTLRPECWPKLQPIPLTGQTVDGIRGQEDSAQPKTRPEGGILEQNGGWEADMVARVHSNLQLMAARSCYQGQICTFEFGVASTNGRIASIHADARARRGR